MSGTPPANPAAPAGGAADPSMEDILASIRRILSDDETAPGTAPAPVPALAAGDDDVIALDSSMMVEMPAPPPPVVALPAPVPIAAPAPAVPAPVSLPTAESLVAPATAAAVTSSVGGLLRTLIAERENVAVHRGGPTIEDMVREEIRPLLKDWLDVNLQPLVERLVRTEIERLVGRAIS